MWVKTSQLLRPLPSSRYAPSTWNQKSRSRLCVGTGRTAKRDDDDDDNGANSSSITPTNLVSRRRGPEEEPGWELAAVEPSRGRRDGRHRSRQQHDHPRRRGHFLSAEPVAGLLEVDKATLRRLLRQSSRSHATYLKAVALLPKSLLNKPIYCWLE